jgi:hypothetical protein
MSSSESPAPESRIGYNGLNSLSNNNLYLPTGYGGTGNRLLGYGVGGAAAAGNDKSTEATTGLGNDDTDLGQGIGYLDYFQNDNVGLTGIGLRRRLALQRALRRRNGAAAAVSGGAGAGAGAAGAGTLSATDLTGAGGSLGAAGLTGLNNRAQGLLGLGSSGYGQTGIGYEPTSVVSGYGYGPSQQCKTGLNPLLVLLTLAAAGAGFYFLYTKVTGIAGRKKRELLWGQFGLDSIADSVFTGGFSNASQLFNAG